MVFAGRRNVSPGDARMLLGFDHDAWGLIAYHWPLLEILRAGVVHAAGDGIVDTDRDRGPRTSGSWPLRRAMPSPAHRLSPAARAAGTG